MKLPIVVPENSPELTDPEVLLAGCTPPKVGIFALTYACNAKCVMCDIWRQDPKSKLTVDLLTSLFSSEYLRSSLRAVNLTGGEPTLRTDVLQIAEVILSACPSLDTISLNSNGFLTERLGSLVSDLYKLSTKRKYDLVVYLSLDGIGGMHDSVRGREGSFLRLCKSLTLLKSWQQEMGFTLGLNFTISPLNYTEMDRVLEFAHAHKVSLDFTYSMPSSHYFGAKKGLALAAAAVGPEQEEMNGHVYETLKRLIDGGITAQFINPRAYYVDLLSMLRGGKRRIGCIFSDQGFFVDPNGDLFRCWGYGAKLGNILVQSFDQIWSGDAAVQSAKDIKNTCQNCFNNCFSQYTRVQRVKGLLSQATKIPH